MHYCDKSIGKTRIGENKRNEKEKNRKIETTFNGITHSFLPHACEINFFVRFWIDYYYYVVYLFYSYRKLFSFLKAIQIAFTRHLGRIHTGRTNLKNKPLHLREKGTFFCNILVTIHLLYIIQTRLTSWPFRTVSWLVLLRHLYFICTEVNAAIASPGSPNFPVSPFHQSAQLPPTY